MSVEETQILRSPGGSRPFDAIAIESDLKGMWKHAARDEAQRAGADGAPPADIPRTGGNGSHPAGSIYRAALANLVVPMDPGLEHKLTPVLVDVTRRHPARLFTIGAGAAPRGARLVARTGAVCHRRESGGGLVCSEQIVLDSDTESAPLIPSAVRSLLIGDLPTVLLDFQPGLGRPWIAELMEMADLILIDSCLMEPGTEPELWQFLRHQGSARVHDLAWARLQPWRAILAEVFDDKEYLPALESVRSVEIGFTGQGYPPPPAWLLAGWLASRLHWAPEGKGRDGLVLRSETETVTLAMNGTGLGEGRALERVRIRSGAPHPFDAEILHRERDRTAHVSVRTPRACSVEAAFGYHEFAACIVGEIHRHASNRPLEDATRAAEELMRHWNRA